MIVAIAAGAGPELHLQPVQGGRDDDRPHRAHQRRRPELRLDRLQQHLRHRPDAVPDHAGRSTSSASGSCAASGRCTNERPTSAADRPADGHAAGRRGAFESNLGRRHRAGRAVAHRSSRLRPSIGIVALAALLYNIVDQVVRPGGGREQGGAGHVWRSTACRCEDSDQGAVAGDPARARVERRRCAGWRAKSRLPSAAARRSTSWCWSGWSSPRSWQSWSLTESLLNRASHRGRGGRRVSQAPGSQFRSWLNADFLSSPQSSQPELAGVRTAILGSLWTIADHHPGRLPDRGGRGHLPGRVRPRQLAQPHHPDQHQQPGRRAVDHLRHAGPGDLRARCWSR